MRRVIPFGTTVVLLGILAGCSFLPTASRTGAVHDITITETGITPEDLTVRIGDEVRWVNRRLAPVWVYFLEEDLSEITCSRGFSLFWAHEEEAKIDPNQSASMCFGREDEISYTVQQERTVIRGSTAGEGGSFAVPKGHRGAVLIRQGAAR